MSKQHIDKTSETITNIIIEKKSFKSSLTEIIKEYKIDSTNEIEIINEVIKKLIVKGYYIENYNPLVIKEI